jgi:hypothetical protein
MAVTKFEALISKFETNSNCQNLNVQNGNERILKTKFGGFML